MAETHPMGIGKLGFSNLIFKRKFRFTFNLEDICGGLSVPEHFVKVAARPRLTIEESELNFLNARTWVPSKAYWNEITLTYIDVATADAAPLYSWLASIYNFTDPRNLEMGSQRRDYTARAIIKLWDGCGHLLERWTLRDVWPKEVNFGELGYDNMEEVTIDLTLRYSDVQYESICPPISINPCCSPCPTISGPRQVTSSSAFANSF